MYFHVITDGTNGKVTPSQIAEQIKVLNNAYPTSGFSFTLAGTDTTVNSRWYTNLRSGSKAEKDMKTALRKGDMGDLNIYTANLGGSLLGWATFPKASRRPATTASCSSTSRCPAARAAPYNLGDTATHEVGHWLASTTRSRAAAPARGD